jgi:hypothetical protein
MFAGVKGGWCVGLQTYHLYVPILLKSGNPKVMELSRPVQGLYRHCFTSNFPRGKGTMTAFSGRFGPQVESPAQIGQKPGLTLPFLFQFMGKLTLRTRFNVKKLIVP